MNFSRLGYLLDPRLFDVDDAGGGGDFGGGGGNTNLDSNSGADGTSNLSADPEPLDLTDENRLIRVKGIDKPVKYGEHVRGFQKEFTKASQRAAELQRQLQERDNRIREFERQQQMGQARQGQNQGQGDDIYNALSQLPYLTGQDAAVVVQKIAGDIQKRDQVILGALKKMQQMEQVISGISSSHSNQAFEGKIAKFLQDGGYDPAAYGDFARELYVAYEGDDLDQEFPNILANRIAQLRKALLAENQAKIQASRKVPFVPGRGGQGNLSKPLEIKPDARPSEIADLLFPAIQGGSGT